MLKIGTQQHWYAVHTRANFEPTAARNLEAGGIETYCPTFEEVHQWSDRQKLILRPAFPGYLFVRIPDVPEIRIQVASTTGVVRILGIGHEIEPVPVVEIDSIRKLLANGTGCSPTPLPREGARVRVRRGPLRNLTGILVRVKNRNRLVISVNLLQQAVAADIDIAQVEVLTDQPSFPLLRHKVFESPSI